MIAMNDPAARMLLILLCSPALVFLVHVAFSRTMPGAAPQKVAILAVAAGTAPTASLLWWGALNRMEGASQASAAAYGALVYGGLAYCYFHFYNMSETARRIRILVEIYKAGTMAAKDLEALYRTTDVVSVRLDRLIALGQLRNEGGRYYMTGRTLVWAGMIVLFWRRLLGLKDGASDQAPSPGAKGDRA